MLDLGGIDEIEGGDIELGEVGGRRR